MNSSKDRVLQNLLLSGAAVVLGLIWIFFGQTFIFYLLTDINQKIVYYFLSGVFFSIAFVGIYGFIKTILCFTEFIIEEDNLFSLIYENLATDEQEGIFLKDKKGVYKIISPVAANILNLNNKKVIGLTDQQLHKLSTANKISHEDQRVLEFGETILWETNQKTTSGEDTFLCKKIPCRDKKDNIIGIIGVCKNITILKTFQNLNLQLEDRYQNLFDKLPYPVLVLDSISLQPFNFNNAMCRLLGYQKEEFSRMRMSLHIQPEKLKDFQHSMASILNTRGGEFETQLVTKQRDTVSVTGYAQEIIIDEKTYLHMLLYDNTETRKSTEILIGSELKYRSLFEHANDAIIIVSPNSLNIIDANEIAITFLGYQRNDLLLMSIRDLDASVNRSVTQEKIADLEIYNHAIYEHTIKNRKGEKISVDISAHKLNYGNEDVYQFVIRNISLRKKTEAALIASESRYRQMFESNKAIKLVINPDKFQIEDANPAAADFYGYTIEELNGMDLAQINILSKDKLNKLIDQTRQQNLGFYSCPHRLANGEIRFVEVRDGPMEIEGKCLFYSIIHDVTASKEAENQVLVASKMFDYSTDAVMLINHNNQIVSVNYAFSQITGYQQSEVQNLPPEIFLASEKDCLLNKLVLDQLKNKGQWRGEIWHRLKDGQSRPLSASINCIRNETSNSSSYVVMFSPRYNQSLDLENKVHFDELTELPNKSLFIDRLRNAVERAQRNKNRLGVILIDFNNFSEINTLYGFDIGDLLLKAISNRLKYSTRNCDSLSHFSSDDFAVLIEDLSNIQQVGIVAQKLLTTLSEIYKTKNHDIEINVSMGISIYPDDGEQSDTLLNSATSALLKAQKKPGNHFELTNETMNNHAKMWLKTEASLHSALRNNEFYTVYMPLINTATREINSLEALIRWQHPEKGSLLPNQFLSEAENTGFIGVIGLNLIDQVLIQFRTWICNDINIPRLDLNICQAQIDVDLLDILVSKCDKYDIPYDRIGLEFSEVHFINTNKEQRKILQQLQQKHFFICIDDYGYSTSSLSSLLQCTVNAIKIDPLLIKNAREFIEAENLLMGIISICNTQRIQVIAEGIETEEDKQYLHALNIHFMQGYLFSSPLSAGEAEGFINRFPT